MNRPIHRLIGTRIDNVKPAPPLPLPFVVWRFGTDSYAKLPVANNDGNRQIAAGHFSVPLRDPGAEKWMEERLKIRAKDVVIGKASRDLGF